MAWETIAKPRTWSVPPVLRDYEGARATFTWQAARAELQGLPGDRGINIAHEAVDRHAAGPGAGRVALRWLGKGGRRRDVTYGELRALTSRFAHALRRLGLGPGDVVFGLLGRIPELHVAALGTLKNRGVFAPLFSAFGPEPIQARIELGAGKALVTTEALYRRKVAPIRAKLPTLKHVLLVGEGAAGVPDTLDLDALLEREPDRFEIPATSPEDPALLHFTSGTTGRPKGALHVHGAVAVHRMTGRLALDLREGDVYWCTADPGWVTGVSYGIVAPLAVGVTSVVDEADFDAARWYGILEEERVNVWYSAPTALRMLVRAGAELARGRDLGALRFIGSVGEPLNPEVVVWGNAVFGMPIHDNWWQTETGGIMLANFRALDVKPGSMGKPLPGVEAGIARRGEGGVELLGADAVGELVLRPGWPSMFRAYLGQPERYAKCFEGGWYFTGDLARRDREGYYWFVGRSDDVIKSSGHLIGPFEIESVLLEHPAVAEAAAIGKPDAVAFETVKAFVALKPGVAPDEALRSELLGFARKRLGAAIAPKEIDFLKDVPKTRSGKIMRRLLKARELGLPEGDVSTLESAP